MALKHCGLLKYFMTQCMRKHVALLEMIVGMWDVNDEAFHVGPHILKLELEDIYFLTRLSKEENHSCWVAIERQNSPQRTIL